MWRDVALRVLDVNPRGWSRARRWGVVGGLMLTSVVITQPYMRSTCNHFAIFGLSGDGTWTFDNHTGDWRNSFVVSWDLSIEHALGWERIRASPVGVKNRGGGPVPPPGISRATLDAAVRRAIQRYSDQGPPESARGHAVAMAGRGVGATGWFFWPREAMFYGGVVFSVGALLVGGLRLLVRRGYSARLVSLAKGHCPGCGYALIGLASVRCPECGLHLRLDEAESRREVGE
jgi:hypothetical protein